MNPSTLQAWEAVGLTPLCWVRHSGSMLLPKEKYHSFCLPRSVSAPRMTTLRAGVSLGMVTLLLLVTLGWRLATSICALQERGCQEERVFRSRLRAGTGLTFARLWATGRAGWRPPWDGAGRPGAREACSRGTQQVCHRVQQTRSQNACLNGLRVRAGGLMA